MGYFVRNLETEKMEIHFSKSEYMDLDNEKKTKIKSYFLWSRNAEAWVSKGKYDSWSVKSIVEGLNFEDQGNINEPVSFQDKLDKKIEKADNRAERYEQLAVKFDKESDDTYKRAHDMASVIPFGQPILVGHHSEKRDRNYRDRIHNTFGKSFELQKKSDYYENKAQSVNTSEYMDKKLKDPVYLQNRIKENKAYLNSLKRNGFEDEHRKVIEAKEKLDFFTKKLSERGGIKYNKENLKTAKTVKCRGSWYPLVRCNPTTITIGNWLGVETLTWKYDYSEIQSAKNSEGEII